MYVNVYILFMLVPRPLPQPQKSQGSKTHVALCHELLCHELWVIGVTKLVSGCYYYPKSLVFCDPLMCTSFSHMLFITYFAALVFFRITRKQKVSPTCVWSVHVSHNVGKKDVPLRAYCNIEMHTFFNLNLKSNFH